MPERAVEILKSNPRAWSNYVEVAGPYMKRGDGKFILIEEAVRRNQQQLATSDLIESERPKRVNKAKAEAIQSVLNELTTEITN